jgi:hypothetical protein
MPVFFFLKNLLLRPVAAQRRGASGMRERDHHVRLSNGIPVLLAS